jgi:hypothetical protein
MKLPVSRFVSANYSCEAQLDEAPRLGRTMIAWLTVECIIDASPTDDCDVWGAGYYLPGPNHQFTAAHRDDPYALAFAQSRLGRLEVTTGRTVFYPIQGEPGSRSLSPVQILRRADGPRDRGDDRRLATVRPRHR